MKVLQQLANGIMGWELALVVASTSNESATETSILDQLLDLSKRRLTIIFFWIWIDMITSVRPHSKIVSQHNSRNYVKSGVANNHKWEVFNEAIPSTKKRPTNQWIPAELYSLIKDKTDYAWYTTRLKFHMEKTS